MLQVRPVPGPPSTVILRPYQSRDVPRLRDALMVHRSVVYVSPTGSGKTVLFGELGRLCHDAGTRVCIMVHRDTLLRQASEKLDAFGVSHSIIAPGRTNFGDTINVASVQTLVRRLDRFQFDLLIPDEGHHAIAPMYKKIFNHYAGASILGFTATAQRPDGKGLGEVYESIIQGPTIRELIDSGYLTDSESYGAAHVVDLVGARTTAGDYNAADLHEIMDRNEVTGDAVARYTEMCPGAPALAFCVSVKHAQDVAERFRVAGYRAQSVDGRMPKHLIHERLSALKSGQLQVITSCDLISEGFDAPGVVACILLRPTKSIVVHMQQVGRGLRPLYAPDMPLTTDTERLAAIAASPKPKAIILDHAGNTFRHGLPDWPRDWTLDGRKTRAGLVGPATKVCPMCYAHRPAWVRVCGAKKPDLSTCNHVFVIAAQAREPNEVEGEFKRIDGAALTRLRQKEESHARTYKELVELGRRRGYIGTKWAYMKWLGRGGDPAEAR